MPTIVHKTFSLNPQKKTHWETDVCKTPRRRTEVVHIKFLSQRWLNPDCQQHPDLFICPTKQSRNPPTLSYPDTLKHNKHLPTFPRSWSRDILSKIGKSKNSAHEERRKACIPNTQRKHYLLMCWKLRFKSVGNFYLAHLFISYLAFT